MRAWYRKSGANGTGLCGKGFRAMGCRRGSFRPARRSLGRSGAVVGAAVRALRAESQGGVRWSLSALRSLGGSGAVVGAAVRPLRAESQGGVQWGLSAPWSLGVLAGRVRLSGLLCGLYGRRVDVGGAAVGENFSGRSGSGRRSRRRERGCWLRKGGSKRGRTVVFTLLPSTCRRRSG